MTDLKAGPVQATLIGDVVGSRAFPDRRALHDRLGGLLEQVNAGLAPQVPLRVTVGDEFQGCFGSVGEAVAASLALRVAGLPELDLRHGLGWGAVAVLEEEPRVEDGPGWWAARAAIASVKSDADRPALRHTRTAYRRADDTAGPDEAAVNAALLLRDELLGGLSERSMGVLRGLMAGKPQREIADEAGVSASAISQRVRNDGLAVLVAAEELLGEVR
jgi:hypothetical protein